MYRADGTKVSKAFTLNGTTIDTDYLDGFVYTSTYTQQIKTALLKDDLATKEAATAGQEESLQLEQKVVVNNPPSVSAAKPSFFPTAEGFYDYDNLKYIYQYKDHLGNVRLSYSKNATTGLIAIEDTNDYYPFGLSFINGGASKYSPSTTYKNFKYNNKELQETGMYDYGARFYMPDLGRWFSPDPLAEVNRAWSPYRYAFDNPLRYIDPDGRLEDWYKDEGGNYVYDANLNASNANTKLTNGEEYLGQSANVTIINSETKSSVGEIHLEAGGNVTVSGEWSDAGNISYTSISKEGGIGLVVDAKLANGAKVYGVDKFAQDSYNQSNYPEMEQFSLNAKEFAQDSFKAPEAEPTTVGSVANKIGQANAGTGIDKSYCSECPRPEAGPGPSNPGYNGFRLGTAIDHLLNHHKDADKKNKK